MLHNTFLSTDTNSYMSSSDDDRTVGVELGAIADKLEAEEYPIEKEELLDAHGTTQIGYDEEGESLQDILGPIGETTYDSEEEVRQAILANVSDESIGRENYSDRSDAQNEDGREEESI